MRIVTSTELSEEQEEIYYDSPFEGVIIIIGPPGSGKTIITADQIIRFADSGDNTVIVELSGVKIPANAIITDVAAVVHTASDLSTHNVNIQM